MARAGWFALKVEAIEQLEGHEFEEFVGDLLEHEWSVRGGSDARAMGGRGKYVVDGGRDWGLIAGRLARDDEAAFRDRYRTDALIPDCVGPVVFSAKSGDWLKGAKKDATWKTAKKGAAKKTSKKGAAKKTAKKAAETKSTAKTSRQVDALADGGVLRIVINTDAPDRDKNKRALAKLFLAWPALKDADEADLIERIDIIDANRLRGYLRACAPLGAFSQRWAEKLGVALPLFDTVEAWQKQEIEPERSWPDWSDDEARNVLRDQVREFLSTTTTKLKSERRRWIVGEPGIGKTRLLAEAALRCDVDTQACIRITSDFQRAKDWIKGGDRAGFDAIPSLRLIVDDVDARQADQLLRLFRQTAPEQLDGALVVVTPTVLPDELPDVVPSKLQRLSSGSVRSIIDGAMKAPNPELARQIEEHSKGVPWFAYLVARDIDPSTTMLPLGLARAAEVAVVGRAPDRDEFDRRVRCLFIVWLCEGGVLPTKSIDKDRLRQAVDLDRTDWSKVLRTIETCEERGIVRRREDDRRYVSPALLMRILLDQFLGPEGPNRFRETMEEHAPAEFQRAMQTLPQLGVNTETIALAARAASKSIERASTIADLATAVADFDALPFMAQFAPRETAEALVAVALRGGETTATWFSEANRVRWALQVAWGHGAPFMLVERGLFALAVAQGPGDWAERLWASSLFFALAWNDAAPDWCMDRLARLAQDRSPMHRRLAVTAFRTMIDPAGLTIPSVPNRTASLSVSLGPVAKQSVERLLDLCADGDAQVRQAAVTALVQEFVSAARLQAIAPEGAAVSKWLSLLDEAQRATVTFEVKRWFAMGSTSRVRWLDLLERKDIVGRVNDVLFSRDANAWRLGVADLAPIAEELVASEVDAWDRVRESLYVREAGHAMSFCAALGRADRARRLLPSLIADVDNGRSVDPLSAYLAEQREVLDDVDQLVRDWTEEPRLTARVVSVARSNVTEEQCSWLATLARRGALSNHSLWSLHVGRWPNVSTAGMLDFIDACLLDPTPKRFAVAVFRLDQLVDRAADDASVLDCCARVMRMAGEGDLWARSHAHLDPIAEALIAAGRAESVAHALAQMLVEDASGANTVASNVMILCAERAPALLWDAISSRFDDGRGGVAVDALLERSFAQWAPATDVARWIGDDVRRARWVAQWCDVDAATIHPVTRVIVERFENDPGIESALLDRMTSGARRGSYLEALRAAIDTLGQWAQDAPTIARWCSRAAAALQRELARQRQDDRRPTGT